MGNKTITIKVITLLTIVGLFSTIIGTLGSSLINEMNTRPKIVRLEVRTDRNEEDIKTIKSELKEMSEKINDIHLVIVENKNK